MSKYDRTANTTLSRRKKILFNFKNIKLFILIYSSNIFVLLINFITK
jgi:hypothetical protein